MTLPTREEAAGWIGHRVNDIGGVEIGTCIKIYADDDTEVLEWIGVGLHGGANAVVPIGDAAEAGGTIRVAYTKDAVEAAPVAASLDFLSREDEVSLYEHYGVPYTAAVSPTTLPLGEDPAADLEAAAAGVQDSARPERAEEAAARDSVAASMSAEDTAAQEDAAARDVPVPATAATASPNGGPREPWPMPEPLPTSRLVPALVVGGAVVAGAAAVRWLPIRRKPAPVAPTTALSRALDRVPQVHLPTGRLSEIDDAAEVARRAGWGVVHAAMVPAAYGAMAVQRTAGVVREAAPRAGAAVQEAGHAAISGANRAVTSTAETASATVAGITGAAENIYDTWRTTMSLLKNSIILGAGYILGTRAGREQYEVIKAKANQVANRPAVQQATEKVKGTVTQKLPGASRRATYGTTTTSQSTPPTSVTAPPPVTPATPASVQDPVTPPRDVTIDLTSDVPTSTERLS